MGVFFSDPKDKVAYYKDQAQKAKHDADIARRMGNHDEATRLDDIADEARAAVQSNRDLLERAAE